MPAEDRMQSENGLLNCCAVAVGVSNKNFTQSCSPAPEKIHVTQSSVNQPIDTDMVSLCVSKYSILYLKTRSHCHKATTVTPAL